MLRMESTARGGESVLGSGNEVTCGIVDQHIERCVGKGGIHQAIDSFGRANVDDMGSNLAGQRVFELFAVSLSTWARRPQIISSRRALSCASHGLAEPSATAGDQHALSLEKIGLEHDGFPLWPFRLALEGGVVRGYKQLLK